MVKAVDSGVRFDSLVSEFSGLATYVDCRVTNVKNEIVILENGETNNIFSENKSFGVRALIDGSWGFSFSNDFSKARDVFINALRIAKMSKVKSKRLVPPSPVSDSKVFPFKTDAFSVDPIDKIKLLKGYASLFNRDSRVKNVTTLVQSEREIRDVFAPSVNVHQEFSNNTFRASVTAREGDVIQSSVKSYSGPGGFEVLTALDADKITGEVLDRVNRLLHSRAPKPERAVVVCDPQMTGLFFHEAVGHACEADAIVNKASIFNGLKGKAIASDEVTLYDDPTVEDRGFYWYDDEGIKAKRTSLINDGVLSGWMSSLSTASELGVAPSGNARCMNAQYMPIPRMSNTCLRNGERSVDELIKEAGNGYLVKGFAGGVVDPVSGQFSFAASECFRIVNGEVGEALRDANLAGSILEVLKTIKVGNDASRTHLAGTCGKYGQGVRVGDFCPSVLVREVIVGGSS